MTLDDIRKEPLALNLEVHAVDPMIYMVFEARGERLIPMVNKNGKSVSFPSRFAALSALKDAGVQTVSFVHRSAYGDMVGLDDAAGDTELRQQLKL